MRTIHRIVIGVLVGLFFAGGYAARTHLAIHQLPVVVRPIGNSVEGTRVASTRLSDVADVDVRPLETLYRVLQNLREHYVEQLTVETEGKMTYDALRAMLGSLNDPSTRFIEPSQRKIISDVELGRFHGIGAILDIRQTWSKSNQKQKESVSEEHLMVASILPESPAEKAGLKPGDEIVAINGKDVLSFNPYQRVNDMLTNDKTRNMSRDKLKKFLETEQKRIENGIGVIDAENLLMSEGKKPIELTLFAKPPARATKLSITPADLTVEPINTVRMEAGDLGYIRVSYFDADTAERFSEAMKNLESKNPKGLIVDLRGATGGNIASAEKISGWFSPNRMLAVLVKSRNRKTFIHTPAQGPDIWTKPVALLVDKSTSRAPEVLAASLRENGVAKLVGEKTYGDFMDTTVMDLADGSAVMMSTGKYLTGKGVDYNTKGLPVDVSANTSDQQLKAAIKLLSGAGGKS